MSYPVLKARLDQAVSAYNDACEAFNKVNEFVASEQLIVLEKISLTSAGILSLTITFIGWLANAAPAVLTERAGVFPIRLLLYFAWFFLVLSLLTGVFARWFYASHRHGNVGARYAKTRGAFYSAQKEYIGNGLPTISLDTSSKEEQEKGASEVIAQANELVKKFSVLQEKHWSTTSALMMICHAAFIAGVVILALFAVITVEAFSDSSSAGL